MKGRDVSSFVSEAQSTGTFGKEGFEGDVGEDIKKIKTKGKEEMEEGES